MLPWYYLNTTLCLPPIPHWSPCFHPNNTPPSALCVICLWHICVWGSSWYCIFHPSILASWFLLGLCICVFEMSSSFIPNAPLPWQVLGLSASSALPTFRSHLLEPFSVLSVWGQTMLWPRVSIGTQPDTPCSLCSLAGNRFYPVSHTLNVDALTFRCEWFWWVSSQQQRRGKAVTGACPCSPRRGLWNPASTAVIQLWCQRRFQSHWRAPPSCSSPHRVEGRVLWDCNSER